MHNLGWEFLLALLEMEGIQVIAGMSALTIPLMFDFTHQQWPMIGCSPWQPVGRKVLPVSDRQKPDRQKPDAEKGSCKDCVSSYCQIWDGCHDRFQSATHHSYDDNWRT
eukprot:3868289-Rhodomonas_salina.1